MVEEKIKQAIIEAIKNIPELKGCSTDTVNVTVDGLSYHVELWVPIPNITFGGVGVNCQYKLSDGPCGVPITPSPGSYSGFVHAHAADWLHWASPTPYDPGLEGTESIFKKCSVCGKTGPENEAHVRYDGHKFVARAD